MKYKDLPKYEIIQKLISTSFDNPSSNYKVWKWANQITDSIQFLESERKKLVSHYGQDDGQGRTIVKRDSMSKFIKEFEMILDSEVPDSKDWKCPIEESWFAEDKCNYSQDKSKWLTPADIGLLMKL